MSKRRWWEKEEQFKAVHRRLRLNYDEAARQVREQAEQQVLDAKADFEERLRAIRDNHARELSLRDEQVAKLAREISRVSLEFSPHKFGARFIMCAQMDENFIIHARDLKELGPFVIERLALMIQREFARVDFSRPQPILPRSWEERKDPVRYRIVPGEGEVA